MVTEHDKSRASNLIWMLDDLFDAREIEEIRKMLEDRGYHLVVTTSNSYEEDYPRYAPDARGVIAQVNFPLGEEAIRRLTSCKIIAVTGIGFDQLDVGAATKHGIVATNAPSFCVEEVSDHVIALVLALNRRLPELQRLTTDGLWDGAGVDIWSIRRMRRRILGVVGFGKIGKAVARKAKGLGLEVQAYDPYVSESDMNSDNVKAVKFEDLVRSVDYLSLHVPLNKETYHLIGADVLTSMKATAFLINTCRGDVVHEVALIRALEAGKIAGAGLDVLSKEPPEAQNPLFSMPNVIISAHTAFISQDALIELAAVSTKAIVDTLEGRVPENVLNPDVLNQGPR
jgi:D-3-phosphoglycerate dehydrogenase